MSRLRNLKSYETQCNGYTMTTLVYETNANHVSAQILWNESYDALEIQVFDLLWDYGIPTFSAFADTFKEANEKAVELIRKQARI